MAEGIFTPGPFGFIEAKLPLIGKAVAGALEKLTDTPERFVFALFVFDTETGNYAYTSDGEIEAVRAALASVLTHDAH